MNKSNLNWYCFTAAELEKLLKVKLNKGLGTAAALARSAVYGKLPEAAKDRAEPIVRLFHEFGEIISYIPLPLCAFVCLMGLVFGEDYGCGITLAVLCAFTVVAALLKFFLPIASDKLTGRNAKDEVKVLRKGAIAVISPDMLVPGDVVFLSDKDVVPCDIRLFDCEEMYVMELFSDNEYRKYRPVAKNSEVIPQGDRRLPERMWKNVVFKGSVVSAGKGFGVVIDPELTIRDAIVLLQRPIIETPDSGKLSGTPVAIPFFKRFILAKASAAESESEKLIREGKYFSNHRETIASLIAMVQIAAAIFVFSVGVLCGADVFGVFLFGTLIMAFPADTVTSIATEVAFCMGAYRLSGLGISVKTFEGAEKLSCAETVFCKNKSLYRVKSVVPERVIIGRRSFEATSYYKDELAEIFRCACFASDVKTKVKGGKKTIIGDADEICNLEFVVKTGMTEKSNVFSFLARKKELRTPDGVLQGSVVTTGGGDFAIIRGNLRSVAPKCSMFDAGNGKAPIDAEGVQYIASTVQAIEADDCHISTAIAVKALSSSDDSLTSGFTLLGVVVYKVNFSDDSAAAVARCRSVGIDPVFLTPDITPGISDSAKRAGIIAYGDRQIDAYELSGIDDEVFFKNIDSYRLFAGLSDDQKRAVIYARKKRSEIVAVCADNLKDIKCAVEGDVMLTTGSVPPTLRKIADIHLEQEGFSSVTAAIEGCRKILKRSSYALRFCMGAVLSVVAALTLHFLCYCGASFFDALGVSAVSPVPAPMLSILLFAVIPVAVISCAAVSMDSLRIWRDIPRVFADKLKVGRNGGTIAFATVVFAATTLLSALVSLALDSDTDSAGLATFITMSVACMLMTFSAFKTQSFVKAEKPKSAFYVAFSALVLFCIWLCVSYTPASFAASFGIFKIGYPTLVSSFVCALIIPVLCEMRKAVLDAQGSGNVNENKNKANSGKSKEKSKDSKHTQKTPKEKTRNETVSEPEKVEIKNAETEQQSDTSQNALSEQISADDNHPKQEQMQIDSQSADGKTVIFAKSDASKGKKEKKMSPAKAEKLRKKQEKKKKADEKAAAKLAKLMEREKEKLEKQRLKDKEDGWED